MKISQIFVRLFKLTPLWIPAVIIMTFLFSCKKVNVNDCPNCPTVLQLIPDSAYAGDTVTIIGEHLMPDPNYNDTLQVKFNGQLIPVQNIIYNDARSIQVIIPPGTESGPVTVDLNKADGLLSRGDVNFFNMQTVTTYAGIQGKAGNDNNAIDTLATFTYPDLITVNPVNGDVFVVERDADLSLQVQNIRKIDHNGGVSTLYTTPRGDTEVIIKAIACDNNANLFVACAKGINDGATSLIQIAIQNGNVVPVDISNKIAGHKDGALDSARFENISSIAFDGNNNMYITDRYYIRKITNSFPGIVSTIAGTGSAGYNDGPALSSAFGDASSLIVDSDGSVYINDKGNYVVRKLSSGKVSTIAGTPGVRGFSYPAEASQSELGVLGGIATNYNGSIYILEGRHCIRKINVSADKISNLTGPLSGFPPGYKDGLALASRYNFPQGMAYDKQRGILYIADTYNQLIRKIVGN